MIFTQSLAPSQILSSNCSFECDPLWKNENKSGLLVYSLINSLSKSMLIVSRFVYWSVFLREWQWNQSLSHSRRGKLFLIWFVINAAVHISAVVTFLNNQNVLFHPLEKELGYIGVEYFAYILYYIKYVLHTIK